MTKPGDNITDTNFPFGFRFSGKALGELLLITIQEWEKSKSEGVPRVSQEAFVAEVVHRTFLQLAESINRKGH